MVPQSTISSDKILIMRIGGTHHSPGIMFKSSSSCRASLFDKSIGMISSFFPKKHPISIKVNVKVNNTTPIICPFLFQFHFYFERDLSSFTTQIRIHIIIHILFHPNQNPILHVITCEWQGILQVLSERYVPVKYCDLGASLYRELKLRHIISQMIQERYIAEVKNMLLGFSSVDTLSRVREISFNIILSL